MNLSPAIVYGLTGLALFVVGLGGLISCAQLMRKILAVNIMASGVFLFLVTIAYGEGVVIDPVPHAMVLTGIVVSVSATAVALILACRVQETANIHDLHRRRARRGER
ncbi:MAG: NADH-quinone oxidoreductase subunit K [Proteobacteria bacterium]|nr:NADH-quinone oxidoreductase subunit K [Pseudomonadota bacterium]MBU1738543.1 NADH-quinone oxidoreductase subunit K [Pseudomonadota bacterium]